MKRYCDHVRDLISGLGECATPTMLTWQAITHERVRMARRGCSGGSIGNRLTAVRSFVKFLILQGYLSTDPTVGIEWPRREDPVVRALSNAPLYRRRGHHCGARQQPNGGKLLKLRPGHRPRLRRQVQAVVRRLGGCEP
ncbi:MAG: hypothetical protein HC822_24545 [Oscillochloris sp.]|nr:hypothetical protein [Oscillochloris sp.]